MITPGARLYFGLAAFALVAAAVLGLASGGTLLGIVSFGWSGPIGDNLGYTVLLGTSLGSFTLGVATTAFRDADATAVEQYVGSEALPPERPPAHLSPWPVVAAFGFAVLLIGFVVQPLLVGVGALMLVASTIEWSVTAWADQATGDPEANRIIRNRLMQPLEVPVVAIVGIAVFVFFVAELLLSLSRWGSIAVFAGAGAVILLAASLLAARPKVSRSVMTAVLLLGGVSLVVGGVIGLGRGHREFHEAEGEHADTQAEVEEEQDQVDAEDEPEHSELGDDESDSGSGSEDDTSSGDSEG